ncbi:ECF RNA polymerase sigma factor SigM [Neolewinella maritima]|uniref:ECF RNA polymerase sigma factor SigM n=2 Tax=Neolewinella maritima TaxID=1383882 RepID=A0ABM9AX30_9BACT|nr:ECF RNA polymerase sigma factor SigM [Neolewinella maritima]
MQHVAAGQLQQLAPLYERYKGPILGFLLNRGALDRATAEDLLHGVFERVITYRTSWRAGQSFRSWVFTIARNLHHDHCRAMGRNPVCATSELPDLPPEQLDDQLTDYRHTLPTAIRKLPDNYRMVVELAWQRNMKYAEIAHVLGTTEANVKVRMHRACKRLRANYHNADKP